MGCKPARSGAADRSFLARRGDPTWRSPGPLPGRARDEARSASATVDDCSLLCQARQAHNAYRARQVFGDENIQGKTAEARARRAETNAPASAPAPALEAQRRVHDEVLLAQEHTGFQAKRRPASHSEGARSGGRASTRFRVPRSDRRPHTVRRFGHTPNELRTSWGVQACPWRSWQRRRAPLEPRHALDLRAPRPGRWFAGACAQLTSPCWPARSCIPRRVPDTALRHALSSLEPDLVRPALQARRLLLVRRD